MNTQGIRTITNWLRHEPEPPPPPPPPPRVEPPPVQDTVDPPVQPVHHDLFEGTGAVARTPPTGPGAEPPTPSEALEQIGKLDPQMPTDGSVAGVPDVQDRLQQAHLREYNRQRAEIADAALASAKPPRREDFEGPGLNAATADHEYRTALDAHNQQIGELKRISAEAKAFPSKSPEEGHRLYEATEAIKTLASRAATDPAAARELADRIVSLKADPQELKAALREAFGPMSQDELSKAAAEIAKAGISTTSKDNPLDTEHSGWETIVTHDAKLLNDVMHAVAGSGDARLKATFFKEAAAQSEALELKCRGDDLDTIYEEGESLKQIHDGMRSLLKNDAAATIKSLREQVDPKGASVQTYFQTLILAGKQEVNVEAGRELALSLKHGGGSASDLGYLLASARVTAEDLKPGSKVDDYALSALAIGVGFSNAWTGSAITVGQLVLSEFNGSTEEAGARALDRAVGLIAESVLPFTVDEAFVDAKKTVFRLNGKDEYTPLW
jgi:hypothetical protein